jgi:flagellar biosynthesis protein FlhG
VLATQQGRKAVQLLVNQASRMGDGRVVRSQLQLVVDRFVRGPGDTPLKMDYLGELPEDPSVRQAVQQRRLLLEAFPGCNAARALRNVAARMLGEKV